MDPAVTDEQTTTQRVRRRASRAAGPAKGESDGAATVQVDVPAAPTQPGRNRSRRSSRSSRRHGGNRTGAWSGGSRFAAACWPLARWPVACPRFSASTGTPNAEQARDQRFVDTATQTVVNMFSYKQDNIDESVNRFFNGTSGPLRGMLGANNNVENLKGLFRSTNATSEAVVNGAALEGIDPVTDNASVLVSVRVTVADIDGVNKPSMPYRLRVIVHEDESGQMTGYDLKYPDGGN